MVLSVNNGCTTYTESFSEWYKPSCLSAWDYTGSYEDSVYVVQQLFTDRTIGYGDVDSSYSFDVAGLKATVTNDKGSVVEMNTILLDSLQQQGFVGEVSLRDSLI